MVDELVITGVRVWSGVRPGSAEADPGVDAIAVRDGRIVAIGAAAEVLDSAGPRAQRLHLPGRTVLPGFRDAHVHPAFAGRFRLSLSLHDETTLDGYRTAIAGYASSKPDLPWIYGAGWSSDVFPHGRPSADLLDDLVPDRPVFLLNNGIHEAWVNSAALRLAGITAQTPDPPDGRFGRDASGAPDGALYEGAAYAFEARYLPTPSTQDWEAALIHSQAHLHSLGITGWQDAWVTPPLLDAYRALASRGELTARVVAALWWERGEGLEQIERFVEQLRVGGGPNLLPRTVKIMVDGVLENGTGAVLSPYHHNHAALTDPAHETGLSYLEPEMLAAAVTELDRLGFQVHLHTIGDRAVRSGLDAIEAALETNGPRGNRHHLAHLQLVDPVDLSRFAELGVVANCQTYWAQNDPTMEMTIAALGAERGRHQYPFASLAKSGARLAMGSDWPVTTADPLRQIEVAVRRVDPADRGAEPFVVEEALPLATALSAFTAGSAYVNHDDEAGVLRVGARADLTILTGDLLDGGPPADSRVEYTIAGGQVVHRPAEAI